MTTPLSLEDLDKDLSPEEQAALEAQAKQEEDDKLKAEEEEAKAKAAAENKTEEELAAEKAAAEEAAAKAAAEAAKANDEPSDDDDKVFYAEVDKRHGFEELAVDYGDTDPLSVEGAYLREKALIEKTKQDVENQLKAEDPKGYAYLLHRRSGKPDEEFFSRPTIVLPDYEAFKKDVDLQKSLYVNDLKEKGLEEEQALMIVEKVIKDNKLFEKADGVYKAKEDQEKQLLALTEKEAKEAELAQTKMLQDMSSTLDDIITNSKTANIVIPDAKKESFNQYIKDNILFDGQNFFVVKPLNKENAFDVVQAEYFAFVKGNLADIVERKAKTEVTASLRRRVTKDTTKAKTGADSNTKTFVPLSEIE